MAQFSGVRSRTSRNKDGTYTSWTYDSGYRLTSQTVANASANATIAYDSRGNLTVKWQQGSNPMTFTMDAANRMVTMLQGTLTTTYTYDDNGNLTNEATVLARATYTYDDEDRPTVENLFGGALASYATYTYSGDGLRRTAFPAGGSLTTMVWDGSDYLQQRS